DRHAERRAARKKISRRKRCKFNSISKSVPFAKKIALEPDIGLKNNRCTYHPRKFTTVRGVTMLERRRFHTIKTATFEYNCCRTKIYKLLGQGKIRAKKLGKKLLLEDDSMREYFTSLPDAEINIAQPSKSKLKSGNASGE